MEWLWRTLLTLTLVRTTFGQSSGLPVVDLGYEVHQAASLNSSTQVLNFSSIRYAQAPTGNLRWMPPVPPNGRNSTVTTGPGSPKCPQANPLWTLIATQFLVAYFSGRADSFNYTAVAAQVQTLVASGALNAAPDPTITEDCLFNSVFVPQNVFQSANGRYKRGQIDGAGGAPVLIWIYGGGYTGGNKDAYDPSGLIAAAKKNGNDLIVVTVNYRLGAFGFLAGPTLQGSGAIANAGLYDVRAAIEWTSKYIHLFGGDPKKITILGESAGGGQIEHQITAYGGQRGVSFQRAIPQSPGFQPLPSPATQENTAQAFLKLLNVSTIAEARNLSSAALIRANTLQVAQSPYGQFTYGPVVDGIFVPALPGLSLNAGAFARNVQLMSGHNVNEGLLFTDPRVQTDPQLISFFKQVNPGSPQSAADQLLSLYPADYSGRYPWRSPTARTAQVLSDVSFICNNYYLNRAYNDQTYAYQFQVPPSYHGDISYTFNNGRQTNLTSGFFAPVADVLQGYITSFAATGNPNNPRLPAFPIHGTNASMNGLNVTGVTVQRDDTVNNRCQWWQKALYY